ncbi:MAG: hypothetical protein K5931_02605 [Lachnospiraceae bacterium]|nr:hypothetical protein [Lachnospiraceae bacterium]
MKKKLLFFAKLFAAFLPAILLIAFTALCPMCYQDGEYPAWSYTRDVQRGKLDPGGDNGERIVILGDSAAMADLVPKLSGRNVVNLAVGGATPVEMYYTFKDYLEVYGSPDMVIIMFSPFHYSYMDNFWTRSIYFKHFSIAEAFKVYYQGKKTGSDTIDDGKHNITDVISCYCSLPQSYLPALLNSRFNNRYSENIGKYREISSQKGHGLFGKMDGCDYLNYESGYSSMKMDGDHKIIDLYMRKILELCRKNSVNTVLGQCPMNESSYSELNPDYISQYTEYIEDLSKIYPQGIYELEIPKYDNMYFGDASHLNEKGAEKFSREFFAKYIPDPAFE